MRLVVSGGGTGGHVYPALAVVAALGRPPFSIPLEKVLYLGTRGRAEEELVGRAGVAFASIAAGAVRGQTPLQLLRSAWLILAGTAQAWAELGRFRPRAILATGGYVSIPVVLAGWLRRVPSLVYLPDVEPGLAVRVLSRFATRVAVTTPASLSQLPSSKTVVTGYPVRPGFGEVDKASARQRWGLDPTLKTLLVWGGSQGARSINREVAWHLKELLTLGQMVHLCGPTDQDWLVACRQALPAELRGRYHLYAYLHEGVPEVMAAADLAVSRAGASVLGEFPMSGLPAVLMPYPHAGSHQAHNARYLEQAGAAVLLPETRLHELVSQVSEILHDEAQLQRMAQRAKALAQPEAARRIAALLVELAGAWAEAGQPTQPVQASKQS